MPLFKANPLDYLPLLNSSQSGFVIMVYAEKGSLPLHMYSLYNTCFQFLQASLALPSAQLSTRRMNSAGTVKCDMISVIILSRCAGSTLRKSATLMLILALPTYPHTLLNFVRALSGEFRAQVYSSILCISYTPLESRVGYLGAFFRVWDLIVVIDDGLCSSG